ncbi:trypsin CFT-1-like isoform X2 [Spodoptera litura]|uniref:Trypsin CFT-1-like isoform X2 n=1 Tax=Spodoptera litura TaxID=69820 RepID=A0A9J7E5N8_SPOLT|nr:trypsin CFT-1-like isoform X2 [Spodoptera litura]
MRTLAILAFCLAVVAAVPSRSQRIIGGSVTTIDQYPSIAGLLLTHNWSTHWHQCGSIILNNRSVLTAAYCTERTSISRWHICVGSSWAHSGGVLHNINKEIIHPQYNIGARWNNDIAILRSATTFSFNSYVRAASIAGANYNTGDSEQLHHVQVVVINQNTCKNQYVNIGISITDNMLCSGWSKGGRDQCARDSGGPVYHNGVVVGVTSFGMGCGDPNYAGVNIRVSRFTATITANA